jgi:hypothetical protein
MTCNPFQKFDFSLLDSPDFKEDAVREELIQPLLKALGYSASGENRIIYNKALEHPYVMIGSKRHKIYIYPDYSLLAHGEYAWVLDAKAPWEEIRSGDNVEQTFSYAMHPHIRVKLYALCNGKEFICFAVDREKPILHFYLSEIDRSWAKLYNTLSPDTFRSRVGPRIPASLPGAAFPTVSTQVRSQALSVLVVGQRLDADVQCVLWNEDEPNVADYDIVIIDLTVKRKPLPPMEERYRSQFNVSDYLTWTHTRERFESLILSGGTIFAVVDSDIILRPLSPAASHTHYKQRSLLPLVIYGKPMPDGSSIIAVDPRFEPYFQQLGKYSFIFTGDVDPNFEQAADDDQTIQIQPLARNRAGEALGLAIRVDSHRSSIPGWVFVLPKSTKMASLDSVKLLIANLGKFTAQYVQ